MQSASVAAPLQAKEEVPVVLRPARPDERQTIRDTWANTFRPPSQQLESSFSKERETWVRIGHNEAGRSNYRWIAPSIEHMKTQLLIEKLLDTAQVEVAVLPDLPDDLVGYVVFEAPETRPLTIHYLYVLGDLRRHRIGTRLFAAALQHGMHDDRLPRMTHMTNYGKKLLEGLKR